ncbi:hypothetical protein EAE96_005822 [Botrytis aclada]|nr:hypothetical protein EAE96_005822 [Botrytis aclada]
MTYEISHIPKICGSCGKRHSPSKLCYTPLKCWNCGAAHLPTEESCFICNGFLLPTISGATMDGPRTRINWKIFLITNMDHSEVKAKELRSAEIAIENDLYTAVLCTKSLDSPFGGNEKKKTAVFLHRPRGKKRLSVTKLGLGGISASSRKWEDIKLSDWTTFEEILGFTSLPSTFPTPDDICLLEAEEGDTDVRGFDGGGPCTE